MRTIFIFALAVVAVAAVPVDQQRIVDGTTATIAQHPTIAALLYSTNLSTYLHACGGVIINTGHILTAAHCIANDAVNRWRVRVGSALAGSGGTVHNFQSFRIHPNYNIGVRYDSDIAILRTSNAIRLVNNAVQAALIAGANYFVADGQVVWTAGWGAVQYQGAASNQLRHVQISTINQITCATRYRDLGETVTDNMLCAGALDSPGRDHCTGDDGGPLYHNNVVIGIVSWRERCGLARYPGVYVRVPRYITWIQANA